MGEANFEPLRVDYDRRLKLKFHGSDISSDAGLLPYRELNDAFGLTELGGEVLSRTQLGENARHLLVELLRSNSTVKGSSCHLTPLAEVSQDHTGDPSTALPERLCRPSVYHRLNVVWLAVTGSTHARKIVSNIEPDNSLAMIPMDGRNKRVGIVERADVKSDPRVVHVFAFPRQRGPTLATEGTPYSRRGIVNLSVPLCEL
jgi:hypothetical protein